MKYNILIVDDEAANLRLLERLLSTTYSVVTADSGTAALDILNTTPFAMIITDQRMPGMTGIEFLKRAEAIAPQTVRMIITGYTDAEALVEAVNSGVVYKYITKPWINSDLKVTIQRGLQHHETLKAQRILQGNYTKALTELDEARSGLHQLADAVLRINDPQGHAQTERICSLASELAAPLGLSGVQLGDFRLICLIKGLLNAGVTERTNGIGNSVDDALRAVKRFETGLRTFSDVPYVRNMLPTLRAFSERYDGSGYPNRLAADGIPFLARLGAVLFAFDEMTNPKFSRPKFDRQSALARIRDGIGTKFDPAVVEALSATIEDKPSNGFPGTITGYAAMPERFTA